MTSRLLIGVDYTSFIMIAVENIVVIKFFSNTTKKKILPNSREHFCDPRAHVSGSVINSFISKEGLKIWQEQEKSNLPKLPLRWLVVSCMTCGLIYIHRH